MRISIKHQSERINESTNYTFGRENLAENLRKIFINSKGGYVIAIDSKWGEGKTTFIHQLMFSLKKEKDIIPIYYDAFANDFSNDTFLSIGATIYNGVKKHYIGGEDKYKQDKQVEHLKKITKQTAIELVKVGADLGVKALTAGLVSYKELAHLGSKFFKDATFGTLELDVDKKFNAYKELEGKVSDYIKALESIGSNNDKVIFFIDELDRCRPDFAVEVLEKTKHLFSAKNVVFVLCYNKTQLIRIISNVYGVSEEDSYKYLEKFVHIEAPLPSPSIENEVESISYIYDELISQFDIKTPNNPSFNIKETFIELCKHDHLKLNLREMERVFSYVSFCMATLPSNIAKELIISLLPAAMIRVKDHNLYCKIQNGSFNTFDFKNEYSWMHSFLGNYFGDKANWSASNVFIVEEFKQACELISMFRTPDQISGDHIIMY